MKIKMIVISLLITAILGCSNTETVECDSFGCCNGVRDVDGMGEICRHED